MYQFLQKSLELLRKEFSELKTVMADQLMYVKEDLILPHHYTFYDFIVTKVSSGPTTIESSLKRVMFAGPRQERTAVSVRRARRRANSGGRDGREGGLARGQGADAQLVRAEQAHISGKPVGAVRPDQDLR